MHLDLDLQPGDERLFVDESLEQIERLEQGLLALERGAGPDTVNEIFRAAHTLKGSAATIRHARMADLTHVAENMLGAVRDRRVDDVAPFMDELLEAVDVLRILVDEVSGGRTLTDRPDELTARLTASLKTALGAGGMSERSPEAADAADAARAADAAVRAPEATAAARRLTALGAAVLLPAAPRSLVRCTVPPESPWKAVRLLQALIDAADSGALIASEPTRAELEAAVDAATLTLLVTLTGDDLARLCQRIATIDEVTVAPVALPAPALVDAPAAAAAAAAPSPADAPASAGGPSPAGVRPSVDRRSVDVGPEGRGASEQERLALAGNRMRLAGQSVRIDVERLDDLMALVSELVGYKTQVQRQAREVGGRLGSSDPLVLDVETGAEVYARLIDQLQEQATRLRMRPIETVFNRFPRAIRDLSVRLGKDVELVIEGHRTELDRSALEQVGDPLGHLVRNSMDHGIESPEARVAAGKSPTGRLRLAAWNTEGRIMIVVEDDGAGIDPAKNRRVAVKKGLLTEAAAAALSDEDAVQLIFTPGFSTAPVITEISGRGVGADVVRTNIEHLGGHVTVTSEPGHWTRFELSLPQTLAMVGSLLVQTGGRMCALPLAGVVETIRVERSAVSHVDGQDAVTVNHRAIPVASLDEMLAEAPAGASDGGAAGGYVNLAIVRAGDTVLGLSVDAFCGEQDIVLQASSGRQSAQPGVAGGTVLADGRLATVIDIAGVIEQRRHRALGAVRVSVPSLSVFDEAVLSAVFGRAMRQAGDALLEMSGHRVAISTPELRRCNRAQVMDLAGGAGAEVLAVHIGIYGAMGGSALLMLPVPGARRLAEHLLDGLDDSAPSSSAPSALGESALMELGNVTVAALLNEIGSYLGEAVLPTVPHAATEVAGAVLDAVLLDHWLAADDVLAARTTFLEHGDTVDGMLLMVPQPDSLRGLVKAAVAGR